jgi:hypothetical protein
MKRRFLVGVLALVVSGCVTVPNSIVPSGVSAKPTDRVTLGMTRASVSAIMDARVMVGYEVDPDTGMVKSLESQNLYSSEIMKIKDVVYQVDRYVVRPAAAGARIAETELFPVVYKAGLVVAVGRDGLALLMMPQVVAVPVKAEK